MTQQKVQKSRIDDATTEVGDGVRLAPGVEPTAPDQLGGPDLGASPGSRGGRHRSRRSANDREGLPPPLDRVGVDLDAEHLSSGPAAARTVPGRVDDLRVATHLVAGVRPGGVALDDDALVLDGAGLAQQGPVGDALRRPRGRDDEDLRAPVDQGAVELGEAQVVARREPDADSRCRPRRVPVHHGNVDDDELIPGVHEPWLPLAEPEPVDLPVRRDELPGR